MKVYNTKGEVLVAACDQSLLGKTFKEGKLTLKVDENFYSDRVVEQEFLEQNLRLCTTANLVGEETTAIALESGFIAEDGILKVEGVPYALFFRM